MEMGVKRCCNLSLIPPEIIEAEILPRLAVKSLLRFKSVSKSWNSFISKENPDLINSHLLLNPNNDSLIYTSCPDPIITCPIITCPAPDPDRIKCDHDDHSVLRWDTQIIGSVNGLVCFFNWDFDHQGMEFAIWNPATKHCLTNIPDLPDTGDDRDVDIEDLFGFGFDSVANDYKVLHVITTEEQPLVADLYSCNRRCWTKTSPSTFLFRGRVSVNTMPVIFRGSPSWLNLQPNGKNWRQTVIWFDVGKEIFEMLPGDGLIEKTKGKASVLMNYRDSVALMVYDFKFFLIEPVDIYVFSERCKLWMRTSIGPLIGKGPTKCLWPPNFFGSFRDGDILYSSCDGELRCINLQSHAIKSYGQLRHIIFGYNYSESLVFLEGMVDFKENEKDVGIFLLKH